LKHTLRTSAPRLTVAALSAGALMLMSSASAFAQATPPTVEITSPGEQIAPETPTPITVSATDDQGIAFVDLYAGDRFVERLTAPPYTFAFQPQLTDLGRTTLVAVATDISGFASTAVRNINVRRFQPAAFQVRTRKAASRRAPFRVRTSGRLVRPAAVPNTAGCVGGVALTYRWRGGFTTTRAGLVQRDCSFRSSPVFLPRAGVVTVTADYLGDNIFESVQQRHRIRVG
jgi:hypothetical protein